MVQTIEWGDLKGEGIVAVLVILGVVLIVLNLYPLLVGMGWFAVVAGIGLGIAYGLLGFVGILNKLVGER